MASPPNTSLKKQIPSSSSLTLSIITLLAVCGSSIAEPTSGGSFVQTTKSYRPADINEVGTLNDQKTKSYAWRGERINWQILLWVGEKSVQAEVKASALVSKNGDLIPAKQVRLDFLKFIKMNTRDRYATNPAHVEHVPEMLNGSTPIPIEAGRLQPLWVGVDIPRNAKPGVYQGKINVKLGAKSLDFPVTIKVLPLTLPKVKDWKFEINLWTHPQAALHYHLGSKYRGQDASKYKPHPNAKKLMWSDKHLALYKPNLILLRDAGLKTITVNLIRDPWLSSYTMRREQHQTNYPYDEMIQWRRKKDGTFNFNFKHFEKYVKFCMDLGIDRRIECFSMLPWGQTKTSAVRCYDEATGKDIIYHFKSWEEYDQVWSSFMEEFIPILVKNGWFEKTVIGIDERGLGNMKHVLKVINKFKHKGKALQISAAANKTHSFDDKISYISMQAGTHKVAQNWSDDQFAKWANMRRSKGLSSSWYTCTGTYPGNFGNSRPAESLFIGWYSARLQADSYLRWAVDSWNDNPTETTDHKVFETGDTFQIYPGDRDAKVPFVRSSVRFELLRQGIVDYEKMQVLKEKFPKTKTAIDDMLKGITRPARPPQIKGNSSVLYDKSTENDFSDMLEKAQKALLKITLEAVK